MKKEYYIDQPSTNNESAIFRSMSNFVLITFLIITGVFCYFFFYAYVENPFQGVTLKEPTFESTKVENTKRELKSFDKEFLSSQNLASSTQSIIESTALPTLDSSEKSAEKVFLTYEIGDKNQTARLVVDFLVDYPSSPYRHKVRLIGAQLMVDREEYRGALAYIKNILSEQNLPSKEYTEAVLLLGAIAQEQKQYDSYIQNYLEQAYFKSQEPVRSQLAYYLGCLLLSNNNFTESLKYFNNVIGEKGLLGKASLYKAQKMYPEAINELENFIKLYPSAINYDYVKKELLSAIKRQAEFLVARGYFDNAERLYLKVLNNFSDSIEGDQARMALAQIYYQRDKIDQSFAMLQEILTNSSESLDPEALFMLGKLSFELNKLEESLGYFRILIEKYPQVQFISKAKEWQNLVSESLRN